MGFSLSIKELAAIRQELPANEKTDPILQRLSDYLQVSPLEVHYIQFIIQQIMDCSGPTAVFGGEHIDIEGLISKLDIISQYGIDI